MDIGATIRPSHLIPEKLREAFVTKNSSHIILSNSLLGRSCVVLATSPTASLPIDRNDGCTTGSVHVASKILRRRSSSRWLYWIGNCYIRERKRIYDITAVNFAGNRDACVQKKKKPVCNLLPYFMPSSYAQAEIHENKAKAFKKRGCTQTCICYFSAGDITAFLIV